MLMRPNFVINFYLMGVVFLDFKKLTQTGSGVIYKNYKLKY